MNIKDLEVLIVQLRDPSNLDKISEINITEMLQIDEENLRSEYDLVSKMYSVFAVLSAFASSREQKLKFTLETLQAQLDIAKRLDLKSSTEKVTESMILTAIRSDERYQSMYSDWLDARKQYLILTKLEQAILLKKDLMISLAADVRASNRT